MIKFTYYGEVVGKGRPRAIVKGKHAQLYTPEKTRMFEDSIRFEFMANNCEQMPVYDRDKSLMAEITVGVPIPQSYSKKKQALCRDGFIAPTKKPDIDNILKSIFDALNGFAFVDDVQVVKVIAEKKYANVPFVEVMIDELQSIR